nr:alpha-glucosidase C-terminal domain-containing protein [Chloroflexota bacterium]
MQWAAGPGNGFTDGDPWQPFQGDAETVNVAAQAEDPASLLSHYRRLIQLHTAHPALAHGDFVPLETSESAVAAFLRQSEEETMLVILNAGTEPAGAASLSGTETGLAAGTYQMTSLLDATTTADLAVEADGSLPEQAPLPTLAPLTGFVFQVQIKAGR